MSLLATVSPENATGPLAETYHDIEQAMGWVPNAMRLYSQSPELAAMRWAQTRYFMQHPRLSPALLAFTRMLVSGDNDCGYCVGLNEAMLINRLGVSAEAVAATKKDPSAAPLAAPERALLLFVLKATRTPHAVEAQDVERMRAVGWTDRDLLEAVEHAARNLAMDVMFNAFKIERDF
ncbi:MAG: hypothetical protein M0037_12765 [Betaproteobacteria bacterium]|nr:hypothetical protein [Betaproteobacteria bacterium]